MIWKPAVADKMGEWKSQKFVADLHRSNLISKIFFQTGNEFKMIP